jgi:predicted metal-dependent hydrolase
MNEIDHIIKTSTRARHVRITVKPDATVIVTIPHTFPLRKAELFIQQHKEWIQRNVDKVKQRAPQQLLPKIPRQDMQIYKTKALALVTERLHYFNARYKLSWETITIRNQKTRWGSCSRKGNLSFNYKIALLPQELVDYIVVHELVSFERTESFQSILEPCRAIHPTLCTVKKKAQNRGLVMHTSEILFNLQKI